jgi:hypothetical protein
MTKFSGELPPELAALVRDFALPLLRYPNKYREALQELKEMDWPELKRGLSRPEAPHILTLLQAYLDAHREEDRASREYIWFFGRGETEQIWIEAYKIKYDKYNELAIAIDM